MPETNEKPKNGFIEQLLSLIGLKKETTISNETNQIQEKQEKKEEEKEIEKNIKNEKKRKSTSKEAEKNIKKKISKLEKKALSHGMKIKPKGKPIQIYNKIQKKNKSIEDYEKEIKETKALILGLEVEYLRSHGKQTAYNNKMLEYKQKINLLNFRKKELLPKTVKAEKEFKANPNVASINKSYMKLKRDYEKTKNELEKLKNQTHELKEKIKLKDSETTELRQQLIQYRQKNMLLELGKKEFKTGIKQVIPSEEEIKKEVINAPLEIESQKRRTSSKKVSVMAKEIAAAVKEEIKRQPIQVEKQAVKKAEVKTQEEIEKEIKEMQYEEDKPKALKETKTKPLSGKRLTDFKPEGKLSLGKVVEDTKPETKREKIHEPLVVSLDSSVIGTIKKEEKFKGVEKNLEKETISTDFDKVLLLVKKNGKIKLSDAVKELNLPSERITVIAEVLEENNLIKINYPPIGEPILLALEVNIEDEKK